MREGPRPPPHPTRPEDAQPDRRARKRSVKRAAIYTLGCRLNQAESSLIADRLHRAGFQLVPFGEPADLAVINTCTVTREADVKSRKAVRACIRRNPDAIVVVVGCLGQLQAESIAAISGVDLVIGNPGKLDLIDHLPERKAGVARVMLAPAPPKRPSRRRRTSTKTTVP